MNADRDSTPSAVVVKVGGSLYADKRRDDGMDARAMQGFARQIADLAEAAPGRVVFVTGGGALGHAAVRAADPADRFPAFPLAGAMASVRGAWTRALADAGAAALPLQLTPMCVLHEDRVDVYEEAVRRILAAGGVPVLSGDCLITAGGALTSISSDRVPELLVGIGGERTRVVVLCDAPGILETVGGARRVIREVDASAPEAALDELWPCPAWDTSRAMHGKLHAMVACARRGAECFIAQGRADRPSLRFLFEPVERWPADLSFTRVAAPDGTARATSAGVSWL